MNGTKKLIAWILAVCLLIGTPMSLDVAAVGTTSATDFQVAHAVVVPDEWIENSATLAQYKGKLILPYFTGGSISNVYDNNTSTDASASGQKSNFGMKPEDTMYTALRIAIINPANGYCPGNADGGPLVWTVQMDIDSTGEISTGPNNYYARLTGSLSKDKLPTSLTAAQKAKYTSNIDTLPEILMLAKDMDRLAQFRIYEQGTFPTTNGIVESYYELGTLTQLAGNETCTASGNKSTTASNNKYDCAAVPLLTVDDCLQMTRADYIRESGVLRITFNENPAYGGRGNAWVTGSMRVINSKGQMVYEGTDGAYTTTKTDGYTALEYTDGMDLESVISWRLSARSVYDYTLNDAQIAAYTELTEKAAALNAKNDGETYSVVYALVEKATDAGRGESANNRYVDSIWNSGKPMLANYGNKSLGVVDIAAQPIVAHDEDPAIGPEDCATIVSIVADELRSCKVTVTFDRAMHLESTKEIYMTYKADPNLNDEGFWQIGISTMAYVKNESYKTVEGKEYSTQFEIQFNRQFLADGAPFMPTNTGVRFCEYNYGGTSEQNNGMITTDYIHDEQGIGLRATVTGGGNHDLAWCAVTPSIDEIRVVAATPINANQIRLNFSLPVTLADVSGITVGGQAVTAETTESGDSWILNIAQAGDVVVSDGAFKTVMGDLNVPAATLTLTDTVTAATSDLVNGKAYNFMNADTGRDLAVGDIDEFTAVAVGNGWYLKSGDRYLDLTADLPTLTDIAIVYRIEEIAYGRHQIVVDNGAVIDTDEGSDNVATLGMNTLTNDAMYTGWLLTESGAQRPMKVLFIGASRTYGTTTDTFMHGWRDTFTENLVDYLDGRVIAVGSQLSGVTAITDAAMLRHEGRPGWMAIDYVNDPPKLGLMQIVDAVLAKYEPDVNFLDVGGNDLAYADKNAVVNGTGGELDRLLDNYAQLLYKLMPPLSDNGALLSSASFPAQTTNSSYQAREILIAAQFEMVEDMRDAGYSAYCNNANPGWPSDGWCSDGHHSESGDAHVAARFIENFKGIYDENGIKRTFTVSTNVIEGIEIVPEAGCSSPVMVGLPYSFTLSVSDKIEEAPVVKVNGEEIDPIDGVYTVDDLFANVQIDVTSRPDLQTILDEAEPNSTVKLTRHIDTLRKKTIVVPAGITLDLNGYTVKVNNFLSFGSVIDSSNGEGVLEISNDTTKAFFCLQQDNAALPLYDTELGGYRLFTYSINSKTPRTPDGTSVKFGFNLTFNNTDAYALLGSDANVSVSMGLYVSSTATPFYYTFTQTTLSAYGAAVLADPSGVDTYVIVLTLLNVDALADGTVIEAVPTISTAAKTAKSATIQQHTVGA